MGRPGSSPNATMSPTIAPAPVPTGRLLPTCAEYDAAAAEIDALLDRGPAPGTPHADRLDSLTLLVDAQAPPAAASTPASAGYPTA